MPHGSNEETDEEKKQRIIRGLQEAGWQPVSYPPQEILGKKDFHGTTVEASRPAITYYQYYAQDDMYYLPKIEYDIDYGVRPNYEKVTLYIWLRKPSGEVGFMGNLYELGTPLPNAISREGIPGYRRAI